jgi:formylglycine-generating enzyme required for sulfatase activity
LPSRPLFRSLAAVALLGTALLASPLACAGDNPDPKAANPPAADPKSPPAIPPPAAPPKKEWPVQPYSGGMVFVDVSSKLNPRIGTDVAVIFNLVANRKDVLQQFLYETPPHRVVLEPYAIDATEVSNAQYLAWIEKTARTVYTTGSAAHATLQQIAEGLIPGVTAKDGVAWGQLYELNKTTLEAAVPAMKGKPKIEWRHLSLPAGNDLVVYTRRLPVHWFQSSDKLADDAGPDHPVRDVSYLDARAFATWAGKHLPTEEEWEWAARGPEQRVYPWGDDWTAGLNPLNGKPIVEKRANWLDLGTVNAKLEPTTLAVETLPEGRSWCGCFHMLGNAGEWTSSWFNVYPGWVGETDGVKNPLHRFTDATGFVKVIRGASFKDRERLVLRNSARAFIGAGDRDPQTPENRFPNVGFRLAAYLRPGLDRLETVVASLVKPKKIREEQLAPARLGGATSTHWTSPGQAAVDHVHVLGPSATILLCPLRALNLDDKVVPQVKIAADILDKSKAEAPLILGAFHTDVPIAKVRIRAPAPADAKPPRRGPVEPHVSEKPDQKIPAGSYIVGIWFGEVALFAPNLDFVGYLGKPTITAKNLDKPKDGAEPPSISTSIVLDSDVESAKFIVWLPIGGKTISDSTGALISWTNEFEPEALEKAGRNWRDSPPAEQPKPADKPK